MKRTKTEKGITLIALIITIIVLLILAVVTINAVKGDGIIQYAESARDKYVVKQANENTVLHNYMGTLKEFSDKVGGEEVTLLTFTMTEYDSGNTKTYYYEPNMKWGEWIDSNYYSDPFSIDEGIVCYDETRLRYMDNPVTSNDSIDPSVSWNVSPEKE